MRQRPTRRAGKRRPKSTRASEQTSSPHQCRNSYSLPLLVDAATRRARTTFTRTLITWRRAVYVSSMHARACACAGISLASTYTHKTPLKGIHIDPVGKPPMPPPSDGAMRADSLERLIAELEAAPAPVRRAALQRLSAGGFDPLAGVAKSGGHHPLSSPVSCGRLLLAGTMLILSALVVVPAFASSSQPTMQMEPARTSPSVRAIGGTPASSQRHERAFVPDPLLGDSVPRTRYPSHSAFESPREALQRLKLLKPNSSSNFPLILCVGHGKTATKSLNKAFVMLGLHTAHFYGAGVYGLLFDNAAEARRRSFLFNVDEPMTKGGHVDAVLDTPVVDFYNEILLAYPNAKVILTVRPTASWLRSQQKFYGGYARGCSNWLPPWRRGSNLVFGTECPSPAQAVKRYVQHNRNVIDNVPAERLLVMDIASGDGWEKLCPFLGMPVPAGLAFPNRH